MLTNATMLHIGLLLIFSFAFIRNVSTNTTDGAFENSMDALEDIYRNYIPKHRILDSTEFGANGPWKRRFELTGYGNNVARQMPEKDKRIKTDYGYGSRLQAGENVAMDWDRNGLFGMKGPGKRSGITGVKDPEMVKRIRADFGYGSRAGVAENAAKLSSYGELFGVHGPGKRNEGHSPLSGDIPKYGLTKRISSDYGYGSRLQAAEIIARLVSSGNLFGVNGPGKRSA